ncbi:MAG: hypothetical protein EOP48_02425 [Sphingobacteriales bacterium]|nr:MAG: hypothetical protein EOP48_02425 [Sphingobacteriales bacterium]
MGIKGIALSIMVLLPVIIFRKGPVPQKKHIYLLSSFFLSVFLCVWVFQKYVLPFNIDSLMLAKFPLFPLTSEFIRNSLIVGISYIGFKIIHFVMDYRDGEIDHFEVLDVLSWLMFFPSIIAGPMQRFQEWQAQRNDQKFSLDLMFFGLSQLLIGFLLKFVLADNIYQSTFSQMSPGTIGTASWTEILASVVSYTFYLYWDFAGYSSIAIGIAAFFGIRLPENFNYPFKARNLAEFWNRWHITLSTILRDYLFYPLSMHLKRKKFFKQHSTLATAIPPIFTFSVAGLWHGPAWGYLIYGLLHGVGLAFIATTKKRRFLNGRAKTWWDKSRSAYIISATINFVFVSFTFMIFCMKKDQFLALIDRLK